MYDVFAMHIKPCCLGIKDGYRLILIGIDEPFDIGLPVIAQEVARQKGSVGTRTHEPSRGIRCAEHLHALKNACPSNKVMGVVHHGKMGKKQFYLRRSKEIIARNLEMLQAQLL